MFKIITLFFCLLISVSFYAQTDSLVEINTFGSNPGNLSLFYYSPKNIRSSPAPLVVVLHGCSESAKSVNRLTGWSELADRYGFYLLFPQQHITNNTSHCFNWFKMNEIERGKGESESIREMISWMRKKFSIDSSQVSITGLSAGAAMSVVMIAAYPELFKNAAIFAGGPYKPGENIITAMSSMVTMPEKTPEEWKRLVWEQNPAFKGSYPKVFIFHGKNDPVVNIKSARELIKQWTAVHRTDTIPDLVEYPYTSNYEVTRKTFLNTNNEAVVLFYEFNNLGHALPVDPGYCMNQGGKKGIFGTDKNFYSTFYTAYEFGLIPEWSIQGPTEVTSNQKGISFSIVGDTLSTYFWKLPENVQIIGDKNRSTITVDWNENDGYINLEVVDGKGCRYYHPKYKVVVKK